eukprot:scaffold8211_cov117-Cylindrotheca_fusiformis.AAC.3
MLPEREDNVHFFDVIVIDIIVAEYSVQSHQTTRMTDSFHPSLSDPAPALATQPLKPNVVAAFYMVNRHGKPNNRIFWEVNLPHARTFA